MFKYLFVATKTHVSCPCHWWLPSKCVGWDREDSYSISASLRPILGQSNFGSAEMVVEVKVLKEDKKQGFLVEQSGRP